MESQGRANPLIRVSPLLHARLKAAAKAERRNIMEVVEFASAQYLERNHPQIISSITSVPERPGPVSGRTPAASPKEPKAPRKPKTPRK